MTAFCRVLSVDVAVSGEQPSPREEEQLDGGGGIVPVPAGVSGPRAEPVLKELFSEGALRDFGHE